MDTIVKLISRDEQTRKERALCTLQTCPIKDSYYNCQYSCNLFVSFKLLWARDWYLDYIDNPPPVVSPFDAG